MKRLIPARRQVRGMTLIELMVATTIFAIGILGLMGMQARAVSNFGDANYRSDAAMLADALLSDIWVHRTNLANYAYNGSGSNPTISSWLTDVQTALPKGSALVSVNGQVVTVTLNWQPPDLEASGGTHQLVETATIVNP